MISTLAVAVVTVLSQPVIPTEKALYKDNTPFPVQELPKSRTDTGAMLRAPLRHPQAITVPRIQN